MGVEAGKDLLLKLGDDGAPESFSSMAGLRMKSISLNARTIDVTHADSLGGWRELLGGGGVKSCSVSGAGVFVHAAADAEVRTLFFEQALRNWQLVLPGFGTISGPFLVAALDYSGRYDGEAAWSLTLSSAGQLGFEGV